jgi:hypothetical protein
MIAVAFAQEAVGVGLLSFLLSRRPTDLKEDRVVRVIRTQ